VLETHEFILISDDGQSTKPSNSYWYTPMSRRFRIDQQIKLSFNYDDVYKQNNRGRNVSLVLKGRAHWGSCITLLIGSNDNSSF
jgi:hypothetical protein